MQISLLNPTFDQIVECIVDARDRDAKCFVQFPWPEEQLDDLVTHLRNCLYQLDTIPPQRIEYDFVSKSVYLDMAESMLHSHVRPANKHESPAVRLGAHQALTTAFP